MLVFLAKAHLFSPVSILINLHSQNFFLHHHSDFVISLEQDLLLHWYCSNPIMLPSLNRESNSLRSQINLFFCCWTGTHHRDLPFQILSYQFSRSKIKREEVCLIIAWLLWHYAKVLNCKWQPIWWCLHMRKKIILGNQIMNIIDPKVPRMCQC